MHNATVHVWTALKGSEGLLNGSEEHPSSLVLTLPVSPGSEPGREMWDGEQSRSTCLRTRGRLPTRTAPPCPYRSPLWRAHRCRPDSPAPRHTASAAARRRGSPGSWTCRPHRWWHLEPKGKTHYVTACLLENVYHGHFLQKEGRQENVAGKEETEVIWNHPILSFS